MKNPHCQGAGRTKTSRERSTEGSKDHASPLVENKKKKALQSKWPTCGPVIERPSGSKTTVHEAKRLDVDPHQMRHRIQQGMIPKNARFQDHQRNKTCNMKVKRLCPQFFAARNIMRVK